jgi:hypothetical protein
MKLFHVRWIHSFLSPQLGGGGSKTTTQTSDPWSGQQPYLKDLFAQAQKQYHAAGPSQYSGETVAPLSPETLAAQQKLLGYARGGAQQSSDAATQALNFNLTDAKDVNSNPYLQAAISGAIRPAQRALTEAGGTIYNIGDQSMAAGQYGGSRQGVAEGIAQTNFNQQALDTAAKMSSEGYNTGLEASTKALALAPGVIQAGTMPAQLEDTVGQQQRQYQQQLISEAIDKWNYDQNLPAQKLAQYQQLVATGSPGGTSTAQGGKTNSFMGAAGGAMAGFGLATMLGGAANGAAWGPYGAGIGAIIGLLGS